MNAVTPVSKDAFFRFIQTRPDERDEYEGGASSCNRWRAGGTRHGEIAKRIVRVWDTQVARADWVVSRERGVETSTRIRLAHVVIESPDEPDDSLAATRPVLIVEVLSPSRWAYNLRIKPAEYTAIPTLDIYMVASQTGAAVPIWQRGVDGVFPSEPTEMEGMDQRLVLATRAFTLTLDLADVYDRLVYDRPVPSTEPADDGERNEP